MIGGRGADAELFGLQGVAVLNEGGRDKAQVFVCGAGEPGGGHPPVNYHAYAACLRGGFYRAKEEIPQGVPVLLLLRKNLGQARRVIRFLQDRGHRVFVSFKESGAYQVAGVLGRRGAWEELSQVCGEADGAVSSTPDLVAIYEAAGARRAIFLPTPYPVSESAWDMGEKEEKREGIFLGTREFDTASRNHRLALELACDVARGRGKRVTLIDDSSASWWARRKLMARHPHLRWVPGPLPYLEYLRLMAGHEVVFQLDRSVVPGQVAGDALLARVLCIGGDGAIERLVFSRTNGFGRDFAELRFLLSDLLDVPEKRREMEREALAVARREVSFEAIAPKLAGFLGQF